MMRLASILLALVALATGLLAAYKWYKASTVEIDLGYKYPGSQRGETYRRMGMELPRFPESGETEQRRINETAATWDPAPIRTISSHFVRSCRPGDFVTPIYTEHPHPPWGGRLRFRSYRISEGYEKPFVTRSSATKVKT